MLNNPSLNQKPIEIKRALISVFDKTGIVKVAQTLHGLGVEILSTGGTSAILKNKNIPVTDVSDYTGFPEIMDGRVKTINPLIEGGILGLRDRHIKDASENRIKWIDLVICNLYPFSDVITKEGSSLSKEMENIDIGGPTMIRAAAKNLGWACVVVDPADYTTIIDEVKTGKISYETRKKFSVKAFGHTAKYDIIIHSAYNSSNINFTDLDLKYVDDNLILTSELINLCGRCFIYVSSIDSINKIESSYALFKKLSEDLIRSKIENYFIIRPSHLIQYGESDKIPNSLRKIINDESITLTENSKFNLVSYEDILSYIVKKIKNEIEDKEILSLIHI